MGGCRCTYKNCALKRDGATHMFHYPVFDKIRCHQWLVNAEKLEFLNLKVSQLKNRVVCQHHFTHDNFMNFLKDKLKFDAVPTEDGPYCDSSQPAKSVEHDPKLYRISLEDIENEYLTFNDKKANFSVKYGDFLTNCELMDLDSVNTINDSKQSIIKDKILDENSDLILNENIDQKNVNINPVLNKKTDNVFTIHMTEVPVDLEGVQSNVMIPNINLVPVPNIQQDTYHGNNIKIATHKPKELPKKKNEKNVPKEKKKITILEERKISQPLPVPFPVKLEPVCSSAILPLPNKRRNLNVNVRNNNTNNNNKTIIPDPIENNNIMEQSEEKKVLNEDKVLINQQKTENVQISAEANCKNVEANILAEDVSPQKTGSNVKKFSNGILKNRIPPERLAAIEEKRKFNMKLRDIIASCLDKLDDEEDKDYESTKLKSKIEKNITRKVSSYLAKEPELPSVHDYTVVYLEARMKKMESILLSKIDQNSQSILELKQSLPHPTDTKAVHTQTIPNEQAEKKHLFQEISKYLSPELNSLLYEELFINKYGKKLPQCSPTRKRKYR